MRIVDFHSHILPCVDDGSGSVEESVKLLKLLANQGVESVVATPHYEPSGESVPSFIARREEAMNKLMEVQTNCAPRILLGAEVAYYRGISRLEGLKSLCIEGTRLLLLEMPMERWCSYTVDEIVNMSSMRGVTPVIAHIERSFKYQDKGVIEKIATADVLCQMNASHVVWLGTRGKAIRLLSSGIVHMLGSDCHNISTRPPRLAEAYKIISKKLGEDFVLELAEFNRSLIEAK